MCREPSLGYDTLLLCSQNHWNKAVLRNLNSFSDHLERQLCFEWSCFSLQCPIDTRKVLSENLVVIGGTAMLPGFLHRLMAEIRLLVEKPKYRDVLASKSFRIHSPPAKPNCTAWLGGQVLLPAELARAKLKSYLCVFWNWSFSVLQEPSLVHCKTFWGAGRCPGITITRQAASRTGAAWALRLLNLCTKQGRPLLRSWKERSPQRSRPEE